MAVRCAPRQGMKVCYSESRFGWTGETDAQTLQLNRDPEAPRPALCPVFPLQRPHRSESTWCAWREGLITRPASFRNLPLACCRLASTRPSLISSASLVVIDEVLDPSVVSI